jgi:hypothetical protein
MLKIYEILRGDWGDSDTNRNEGFAGFKTQNLAAS